MPLLLACCKVQLVAQSDTPARRCWAIIRGFLRCDTIAGGTGTQSGRRFPNPSASRGCRFCSSWNRLLCSMLVMFLRARCWLVGAFAVHIQPENELQITNWSWHHTVWASDWQLKHCDTFCSMAYIFKRHLNNIRKWLLIFENIIEI